MWRGAGCSTWACGATCCWDGGSSCCSLEAGSDIIVFSFFGSVLGGTSSSSSESWRPYLEKWLTWRRKGAESNSLMTSGFYRNGRDQTHLEHPGAGLGSVLEEARALLPGGLLQPTFVVHVGESLWAADLSAGRLIVGPDAIQGHLSPPADRKQGQDGKHHHTNRTGPSDELTLVTVRLMI